MSRLSQLIRGLRNRAAVSLARRRALPGAAATGRWAHARVLSIEPLIFMRLWKRDTPQPDILDLMPAALRAAPFHVLIVPAWSLENPLQLDALEAYLLDARDSHPGMHTVVLCNTEREVALARARGLTAVFVNQNAFADERVFQPISGEEVRFDAIYNATFLDWKRHALAAEIDRLALIGYMYHATETASALATLRARLPKAELLNRVENDRLVWLDAPAVNRALNQARVGLCLSAEEGANFASIEYLLAGLPIVSTPSIGGRDLFFDPEYCLIVEPDCRAVREAVEALIARNPPRALVRERTLARLAPHRERFCSLVQSLLDGHGMARNFASEWQANHRHQWLEWVELHAFWQEVIGQVAALRDRKGVPPQPLDAFQVDAYRRWTAFGLSNIKPSSLRYGEFPEGWDVIAELRRIAGPFMGNAVLELGCGYGRICRAFPPESYLGIDINEQALERARLAFPQYRFERVDYVQPYPRADLVVAYTVFLHLSDDDVAACFLRLVQSGAKTILIAEPMSAEAVERSTRSDRGDGASHPTFSRSRGFYEAKARAAGLALFEGVTKPYHYFPQAKLEILIFKPVPQPPAAIAFPQDFANPFLDYRGIDDDCWCGARAEIVLTSSAQTQALVVAGSNPAPARRDIALSIDGRVVATLPIAPGDVRIAAPVSVTAGPHRVGLEFGAPTALPPPDGRIVGLLLKHIGFA